MTGSSRCSWLLLDAVRPVRLVAIGCGSPRYLAARNWYLCGIPVIDRLRMNARSGSVRFRLDLSGWRISEVRRGDVD
jgi:hypothetical protein